MLRPRVFSTASRNSGTRFSTSGSSPCVINTAQKMETTLQNRNGTPVRPNRF